MAKQKQKRAGKWAMSPASFLKMQPEYMCFYTIFIGIVWTARP